METKQQQSAEDFKDFCVTAYHESGLKQEVIADACGTTQANVSRWFRYTSDLNLPAYIIPNLPEKLRSRILLYLATKSGYKWLPVSTTIQPNGSLDDELIDGVRALGSLAEDYKRSRDIKAMRRHVMALLDVISRIESEINTTEV